MEKLSIKNWAIADRPREKLLLKGINSLSDAELIAILLGSGSRKSSAVELAKNILKESNNNLHQLGKLSISDLQKFHGIGPAKAISIAAAMELGRRRKMSDILERKKISSSTDAFEFFYSLIADLPHEEFWVLLLNKSNKIITTQKISQGGIDASIVDVRLILQIAILKSASGLIVCHNHPSGNKNPSKQDKDLTHKINQACGYLDIRFLDHIIVANKDFYSFADEEQINNISTTY